MSSQTVRLTIHVAPVTVVTEADDTRLRNMAGNIEQGMSANYLGLEIEGTLHLFPQHSIRAIEISPAPKTAMKHVVRDVRRSV